MRLMSTLNWTPAIPPGIKSAKPAEICDFRASAGKPVNRCTCMNHQLQEYIKMLGAPDAQSRCDACDWLVDNDDDHQFLTNALHVLVLKDPFEKVREKAIAILSRVYKETWDRPTCELMAQVVYNQDESYACRRSAYFAMHRICDSPYVERNMDNLVANVRWQQKRLRSYLNFDLEKDIDWNFVNKYRPAH